MLLVVITVAVVATAAMRAANRMGLDLEEMTFVDDEAVVKGDDNEAVMGRASLMRDLYWVGVLGLEPGGKGCSS
jgi:hypothetical protein